MQFKLLIGQKNFETFLHNSKYSHKLGGYKVIQ